MRYLIMLLTLSACGPNFHVKDPAFLPYLATFMADAAQYGVHPETSKLTIEFDNSLIFPEVAQCREYKNGAKVVIVDKAYWNRTSEMAREAAIYHELGHCLLGREHTNVVINGLPGSLMNTRIPLATVYAHNRDGYVRELFTGVAPF